MVEKTSSPASAALPQQPSAARPRLGLPGSDLRWLMPILLCVGVLAVVLLLAVFLPLSQAVEQEPDLAIQAVLADNLFLLHLRVWTILLIGALVGGAFAVHGARQSAKALVRLELRLRRIADGEFDLPPTDPARDFAQFDEVFACLRSGIERTARRYFAVLQQVQSPLRALSQKLAAGEVPRDEARKSVSAALNELDALLDADRRASARPK